MAAAEQYGVESLATKNTKDRKEVVVESEGYPTALCNFVSFVAENNGKHHDRSTISPLTSRPSPYVLSSISQLYLKSHWQISHGLELIFKAAGIRTSVMIEGRSRATPEATFHSLRHTFVSLSANAGMPLTVIASIVGHSSTAMTRHYYHENEEALRRAVAAIPSLWKRSWTRLSGYLHRFLKHFIVEQERIYPDLRDSVIIHPKPLIAVRHHQFAERITGFGKRE